MKTLIATLLITCTATTYAKPGGWIKDFFQGSSISISSGYYPQQQSHCHERVYHCEPAVIYYEPARIHQAPHYYQPHYNVPMQPYQNQTFQWQGKNYNKHCR